MVNLSDYPSILIKMLNACIKSPHINLAIFSLHNDSEARLDFIQNMEYKFLDLLVLPFHECSDAIVRQHVTYRYKAVRTRLTVMTQKLQDVSALVKVRPAS